jgi:hypothetical protein
LRRLAIAQLGSTGFLDESEFIHRVVDLTIRKVIPGALRVAAKIHPTDQHKQAIASLFDILASEPNVLEG